MSKNGVETNYLVHRLVAQAFIPNPENEPQVNHIDGDKTNNHVDNLEWCTNSYNTWHSYNVIGNRKDQEEGYDRYRKGTPPKKVKLINTGQVFDSINQAQKETGIDRKRIRLNCNNRIAHTIDPITKEKFMWEFVNDPTK